MKRRKFVLLSVVGVTAAVIPYVNCRSRNIVFDKSLAQPLLLAQLCDEKTILEIGTAYGVQTPAENKEEQLVDLLLADSTGKTVSQPVDSSFIHSFIKKKIQQDFEKGSTVIVKGWVLSATEARQCALYSLTKQ